MSKPSTGKSKSGARKAAPESVEITFDLYELPTAQHKAGLAGLLMQIESMKNRGIDTPDYEWDDEFPSTKVKLTFTQETSRSLFDDLYDATLAEGPVREKPFTKGKGADKKIVEPLWRQNFTKIDKKGKEKTVEGYVYEELAPSLNTLNHYLPEKGEWVKLWRDLIWQIIREGQKKAPYILRASRKKELNSAEGTDTNNTDGAAKKETSRGDGSTWDDLLKFAKQGTSATGKLSGALLLGAMEKNAESIVQAGRVDQNLLLHFWPLAVMVFVPQFVDSDGETHIGRRSKKDSAPHYCIAVPEVADLRRFIEDCPRMYQQLNTQVAAFRPRDSLIDVPAQSALAFITHLATLAPGKVADSDVRRCISAIDYFHLVKEGNNVKFLARGRVLPRSDLIEEYQDVVGRPGEKRPYENPMFRSGLMSAMLDGQQWYKPFARLFHEWPAEFFVRSEDSPKHLSWFWIDARKKFDWEAQMADEPDAPTDARLMKVIYRVVQSYVLNKASSKSNVDLDKFRGDDGKLNWEKVPSDFTKERSRVGESLFLELRSRRDQAFVDHFTITLFAGKQYLSEADCELLGLALFDRTDDVKTLTLMALSANS